MRRRRYLFSYDVSDDKRRDAIFETLRDNGDHAQFSVFFCELSPREFAALNAQLSVLVHPREDQILVLDLGDAEAPWESGLSCLGKAFAPPSRSHIF